MKQSIVVISCKVLFQKQYVKSFTRAANRTFVPVFTSDVKQAYDFETEKEAEETIPLLSNPFHRKYKTETRVVNKPLRTRTFATELL